MSYWDNFEEVSPSDYWGQFEETETKSPSLTPGQKAWNSIKHDLEDMGYGIKKGLSGATFGASDWALRKLGFTDDDYLARREAEGLGGRVKLAGMGAELGGNMLGAGGMLVKGLAKGGGLAASRLGQAIKYKGLENLPLAIATGTIEGGIQNSFDRDSLGWDTVGGAIEGAIGGSLGYGAGKLLGKGIVGAKRLKSKPSEDVRLLSGLRKDLGKVSGNQQYADELIDSALLDATRQGKSIIEVADDSVVDLAQGLRQQTPEAGFLLKNRLDLAKEAQPKAMRNFVNDTLGTASRGDSIAEVTERARQAAQPIYDRLDNMGDLKSYEVAFSPDNTSKLDALVNENDVIKDAIKSVKRAYSSFKKLPDTDFRVMNEARSLLSEQTLAPNTTLAYQAKAALREFDPILDEVIPDYKIARGIYENAHKFEEASKLSKDVFSNNKNPSDFQNAVSKLSSREKDALAIGLRDDLLSKIGSRENEALGFKGILPQNVQDKMRIAIGTDKADKIINEAKSAIRLNQNYNTLLRGSQTAEKLKKGETAGLVKRLLKNPFGVVGEVVEPISNVFRDKNNVKLAQLLTKQDLGGLREGLRQYNGYTVPYWLDGNNLSNLGAGLSTTTISNTFNR